MKISRRSAVAPFLAMDIYAQARALEGHGRRILHLEVGQPSSPAPKLALDAAAAAMGRDVLGYTEALGRQALKRAIAEHYQNHYGVSVAPDRVVITTGSSSGFILAFLALFDVGDTLAIPRPGYPAYRNTASALGLRVASLPADVSAGFVATPGMLDRNSQVDGLLIASPGNPTGTVFSPDDLGRLAHTCRERGIALISDEIYHGLAYEMSAQTALAFDDNAIVINSFSKYYSMTGWRIGWMVVPDAFVRTVERLAQNLFICAPAISQVAALAALSAQSELDAHVARYRSNRDVLLRALARAGLDLHAPADGAFYLYVKTKVLGLPSQDLCKRLLHEAGIAATPGADFDQEQGDDWIRLSYAGASADIEEAGERFCSWALKTG
ncbi:MAG TPA: 1-aminocyclopropane-1-carboxylate deaminase [Alphaproteobacteria bacterium]|nr:1-aminocyclopropane-1-carboxylate deaminase [Alphaproteobacteria bacterium]HAJ48277.1 1-aminocyclopropane-1-carboxylate deaminase [Alphaproteobacteria bacterium]